jgi:hypothetical protein
MKKIKLLFLFVIIGFHINAQSVSIGTIAARGKLTVLDSTSQYTYTNFLGTGQAMGPFVRSTLGFGGTNYVSGAISTIGIDASSARMVFYTGYTAGDILSSPERITIANNGWVGINNSNPQANLDLIGNMKVSSFNSIEFGAGVAGKETNAGKIGYRTFTADALDIVGAGSSTLDRKVKIYAESGTTFTGPINIAGSLQVFGNSGTAGQVLTSNGSSSPLWTNAAYGNTIRFSFDLSQTTVGGNVDSMNFVTTNYNLSPAQVFVVGSNSTRLQINKTGLYHFSGSVDMSYLNLTSAIETGAYLDYYVNNKAYPIDMGIALHVLGGGNHDYYKRFQFSFDVHLTAGQAIKFEKHFFPFSSGFSGATGYLNGYLVAD